MSTELSHLKCVIEVAVCGVLDADGGYSSTGVGGGTRNGPGGLSNTTHCRSNHIGLDILEEEMQYDGKWVGGKGGREGREGEEGRRGGKGGREGEEGRERMRGEGRE